MLEIKRIYLPSATVGHVYFDNRNVCYSLERPWLENKNDESCIPEGVYSCIKKEYTSQNGETYNAIFIMDVPKRTGIYVHGFNKVEQSKGCIAFGLRVILSLDECIIYDSRAALEKMLDILPNNFNIEISG